MQIVIFTEVCHGGFGRYAGTYRIATELREAGYTVQVVEFFTYWETEDLIDIIDKFVTDDCKMVGFSCTFLLPREFGNGKEGAKNSVLFGREDIFEIIEYIKIKGAKIVVGGANSYLAEDPPFSPIVDFVCGGQSDASIRAVAEHIFHGTKLNVSYVKNGCQIIQEKSIL